MTGPNIDGFFSSPLFSPASVVFFSSEIAEMTFAAVFDLFFDVKELQG